jgi:hypothetical protein
MTELKKSNKKTFDSYTNMWFTIMKFYNSLHRGGTLLYCNYFLILHCSGFMCLHHVWDAVLVVYHVCYSEHDCYFWQCLSCLALSNTVFRKADHLV